MGLLLLAAVASCAPAVTDAGSAPQSAPPYVSLRVAGAEGYAELLAAQRGKVVLVDFWATWCAPCVEQFPHTVAMHRKYQERGLVVIGVSMNEPVDLPHVRDFLVQHEARFENLLSKYESGVKAVGEFGLPGPVPCYRVYDRAGVLRREFVVDPRAEQQFAPRDIEASVVKLLKAGG